MIYYYEFIHKMQT